MESNIDKYIYKCLTEHKPEYIYNYYYDLLSTNAITEVVYLLYKNPFFTYEQKTKFMKELCETKKHMFALCKFKYIYIQKRLIKTCDIKDSLCCIKLNTLSSTNKFNLIEDRTSYTFYINDLHTIMYKSLTLSDNLFNKPALPNNPYTNNPISLCNLYNFYLFCNYHNKLIPEIFHRFYKSNFCITTFFYNNEYYVRDIAIKSYYNNIKSIEKYYDIILLLRKYKKYIKKIKIHPDYNKLHIVKTFEPILTYDLFIEYSFNHNKKKYYKNQLIKYLKQINTNTPMIGQLTYQEFSIFKVRKDIHFTNDYKNNPDYYKADILSYKYKHIPNVETIIEFIMNHLTQATLSQSNRNIRYHFTEPSTTITFDDYGEEVNTTATLSNIPTQSTTFQDIDFIL